MISQLPLVACCHASCSIRDSSSGSVSKNKPVSRSRSWPWCLLQQQKAPNTFWSLWKFTSSFGKLEVQDNVFRGGCNSSVVRHISQFCHLQHLRGFTVPRVHSHSIAQWDSYSVSSTATRFLATVTLETKEFITPHRGIHVSKAGTPYTALTSSAANL